MNALEIARKIFPESKYDDDFLSWVIWNQTGYPSFWSKEDENNPEECLTTSLHDFRFLYLWNLELPENRHFRELDEFLENQKCLKDTK